MGVGDLAVRQHLQARRGAAQQPCHRGADQVGHQQAGGLALVLLALDAVDRLAGQGVGHARVERGAVGRGQRLGHQPLQFGLERDHVEFLGRAIDLLDDGRRQVHADALGQLGRVGHCGGTAAVFGQAFDDRAHVADVNALFEQQLQHLLDRGNANHLGDHVVDQFGSELVDMVNQRLGLDPANQARGVGLHQV